MSIRYKSGMPVFDLFAGYESKMLKPLPLQTEVETKAVLQKLAGTHKAFAELKGLITGIPNENIILQTLTLREAIESSIENIISTSRKKFSYSNT